MQLMLGLIKNPSTTPYFASPYTQRFGDQTTAAIKAFQADQKLTEKLGLIEPAGATWSALLTAFSKLVVYPNEDRRPNNPKSAKKAR